MGTFDILHYGHLIYLEECALIGDVIVGLSTDANALSKRSPIMSYSERATSLALMTCVKKIVPKDEPSAKPIISVVDPHILTYGSDWTKYGWLRENLINLHWLEEQGIALHEIRNTQVISTTEIIERIASTIRNRRV
jgi:D-beta-D-heptose 7-phosphate kinase/D-beta-D-heptose 1-phosphate adenosyltransferase